MKRGWWKLWSICLGSGSIGWSGLDLQIEFPPTVTTFTRSSPEIWPQARRDLVDIPFFKMAGDQNVSDHGNLSLFLLSGEKMTNCIQRQECKCWECRQLHQEGENNYLPENNPDWTNHFRLGVSTRSMRSQQPEFPWGTCFWLLEIFHFLWISLDIFYRSRDENSKINLPSPGYVARREVPGPPRENCPPCLQEMLTSSFAAHLAQYHWFYYRVCSVAN